MAMPHPKLSKSPLVEAVFEIRFATEAAYGLMPGRMFDKLGSSFPQVEELQSASLPLDLPLPVLVRHRFQSADGTKLFQTGQGVLSVNHLAYQQYRDFRQDIEHVLEAFIDLGMANAVLRLGLRYINQVKLDRNWASITTLTYDVPETVAEKLQDRRLQYRIDYEPDYLNLAAGNLKKDEIEVLRLDLDFVRERTPLPPLNGKSVLDWLDTAHANLYEVFISLLTDEYLGEIR